MKVPFSWLKEYVDIDISAQELETKLFSCVMVVVRVKNFYDIAGKVFLLNCFFVITFIERVKLEVYDWLCIPDS